MSEWAKSFLAEIETVEDMVGAFSDEVRGRKLLESMVWPRGRTCPACGFKRSSVLTSRLNGAYRARPGLYQCSNSACRFQFTVTTHTPLHATKLPLSVWMKGLWFILQSDKAVFRHAVGRQLRRLSAGGIEILSKVAVFG